MANYENSKINGTEAYPVISDETSNLLGRCEGLLTPSKLKSRFLKGIDIKEYSTSDLKDQIEQAINRFEIDSKLFYYPTKFKERLPFDRSLYRHMVFMKTQYRPILSIEDLSIVSSNGDHIYRLPSTWVESGQFNRGQVNLIPILSIFGATNLLDSQASNAGLIFITAVNNFSWLPAFFTIEYTAGMSNTEGQVPRIVNDIVGMIAAIEILSNRQATFKYNSTSIGQDGVSQSSSGPGPQTYQARIDMLEAKKIKYMGEVRAKFHSKYYLSNI